MNIDNLKKWSELLIAWLTILGTFIGAGYALFQYNSNINAERVKETLVFVDKFDNEQNTKSKQYIEQLFEKIDKKVYLLNKDGYGNYNKFLSKTINNTYKHHLNNILDFYDGLYICATSKLCSNEVAVTFFGKYAYDIVGTLYPYIEEQQIKYRDIKYGEGVIYFSIHIYR